MFQNSKYLSDILEIDPLMGSFFFEIGIEVNDFSNISLKEVCKITNTSKERLLLELSNRPLLRDKPTINNLKHLPIDVLISYLKNAHQKFLWQKLPFMSRLIESLDPLDFERAELIKDLKIVFPIFTEDFIHHIHEEEDVLFSYVLKLNSIIRAGTNPACVFFDSKNASLYELAMEHIEDDDEMLGIRKLTNNYHLPANATLNLKLLFAELQDFESTLKKHARIENEILFPKAMKMQVKVKNRIQKTSVLN